MISFKIEKNNYFLTLCYIIFIFFFTIKTNSQEINDDTLKIIQDIQNDIKTLEKAVYSKITLHHQNQIVL